MQLYYYKDKEGNYGDDLNAWLWERLLPGAFNTDDDMLFCGIGTILDKGIPSLPRKKIIFSCGAGYGRPPEGIDDENWNIISVRGPLTAKLLNLPQNAAVTDGAILLATLPEFLPLPADKRNGIVFMPHHRNALQYGQWQNVCNAAGITFLDPRDDSIATTQSIRHAKLVIAEAMHAAIVADTMRVPWFPVVMSHNINHFKWLDWTSSLGLAYQPITLPPSTFIEFWKDIKMRTPGDGHALPDFSENQVLMHMRSKFRLATSSKPPSKTIQERMMNGLETFSGLSGLISLGHLVDKLLMRQSVKQISKIITNSNNSFLSTETIYQERLSEMNNRLDVLRKLIA